MPKFPRREAEVIALADEMIAGYVAYPTIFPSANVSAMQGARSLYGTSKDAQTGAHGELAIATEAKQQSVDALEDVMHLELRKSETDTAADPQNLTFIGWGPKSQPTPSERPGQPRSLESVKQGQETLHLDWKHPATATGGTVRNYIVERRELVDGEMTAWHTVGTAIETEVQLEGQPRGVSMEYHVIAINVGGQSDPSNSIDVVL